MREITIRSGKTTIAYSVYPAGTYGRTSDPKVWPNVTNHRLFHKALEKVMPLGDGATVFEMVPYQSHIRRIGRVYMILGGVLINTHDHR